MAPGSGANAKPVSTIDEIGPFTFCPFASFTFTFAPTPNSSTFSFRRTAPSGTFWPPLASRTTTARGRASTTSRSGTDTSVPRWSGSGHSGRIIGTEAALPPFEPQRGGQESSVRPSPLPRFPRFAPALAGCIIRDMRTERCGIDISIGILGQLRKYAQRAALDFGEVMRTAGPRMAWRHPWLSIVHLWKERFRRAPRRGRRPAPPPTAP